MTEDLEPAAIFGSAIPMDTAADDLPGPDF
jgi:hypothetical protein